MKLSLRSSRRASVGLDLDGAFLAAAEVAGRRLVRAASAELPAGAMADGEVADVDALAAALKELFAREKLPRSVRLGVANQQIVVRQLDLPVIANPEEEAAAVRFQAAEAIAMPLDDAVLDYQAIGEEVGGDGVGRRRFVVVAARSTMIDRLVAAVRAAGLRPEGIDLNAFALVRLLTAGERSAAAESPDSARVFCHLGGVTNLAVALGSSCLFARPLATARPAVAAGFADGPDPDAPPEADSGLGFADSSRPAADAAALAEEIRMSIDYYMAQPDARWVTEMVLSGPGATRPGLAEEVGDAVGLPVSVAEPLGALDATALPDHEDAHRHTVAAGLALGAES